MQNFEQSNLNNLKVSNENIKSNLNIKNGGNYLLNNESK